MASFSIKLPLSSSSSSSYKPLISCLLPRYSNAIHFKPITFQPIPTFKTTKHQTPSCSIQPPTNHNDQNQNQNLPLKLQEIVNLFQSVTDPRAKYQQLLFYANTLPPLDEQYKTQENKVQGCVSQVWLRAYIENNTNQLQEEEKVVYFEADSDSSMTKGLAALLVLSFSGLPVKDILRVSPDFVTHLGLQQNLTQSRNNGFLNMFRLMQHKALLLGLQHEKQQPHLTTTESSNLDHVGSQNGVQTSTLDHVGSQNGLKISSVDDAGAAPSELTSGSGLGERGERMREILERELKPLELEIEDISYQHAGHVGVRGSDGGETHFNVKIVSPEFQGKSLVRRHRMVYQLLQPELDSGLHALSIIAKTPQELESDN